MLKHNKTTNKIEIVQGFVKHRYSQYKGHNIWTSIQAHEDVIIYRYTIKKQVQCNGVGKEDIIDSSLELVKNQPNSTVGLPSRLSNPVNDEKIYIFNVDNQHNNSLFFIVEDKPSIVRGIGRQLYFIMINTTRYTHWIERRY